MVILGKAWCHTCNVKLQVKNDITAPRIFFWTTQTLVIATGAVYFALSHICVNQLLLFFVCYYGLHPVLLISVIYCLLNRIHMKTKIIVFLIGVTAVSTLVYTFVYYGYEENISSLSNKLLTDQETVDLRSPLLSGIDQPNYDLTELSKNAKNTVWYTSLDSRNVVSIAHSSYSVHIPFVRVPGINCGALFTGDIHEIARARVREEKWPKRTISDDIYVNAAADCTQYIIQRRFTMHSLSSEEAAFPLAFSIIMFRDVELFERLLRAIYRPQNFYCVHVDQKSASTIHGAVAAIASCFSNVFIAPRVVDVSWGTYTVLEAELICMEALLSFSRKWRYFINLTGQEFPLKTNLDIVKILKVFRGANNIEGTVKRLCPAFSILSVLFMLLSGRETIIGRDKKSRAVYNWFLLHCNVAAAHKYHTRAQVFNCLIAVFNCFIKYNLRLCKTICTSPQ